MVYEQNYWFTYENYLHANACPAIVGIDLADGAFLKSRMMGWAGPYELKDCLHVKGGDPQFNRYYVFTSPTTMRLAYTYMGDGESQMYKHPTQRYRMRNVEVTHRHNCPVTISCPSDNIDRLMTFYATLIFV